MTHGNTTAAEIGVDRRKTRGTKMPAPEPTEDDMTYRNAERYLRAYYEPWDRYLATRLGSVEALEILQEIKCLRNGN